MSTRLFFFVLFLTTVFFLFLFLEPLQDPRFTRLPCTHPGTYADDCICERVRQHKCYIVATCDTDLK